MSQERMGTLMSKETIRKEIADGTIEREEINSEISLEQREEAAKKLIIKQGEGYGSKIEDCMTEEREFKLLGTESVGTIVEHILEMENKEEQIKLGQKLIDSCVRAGIIEPSYWSEVLKYPENGHEDGFSFKWINHYQGDFTLRYEGWEQVSRNLHVLVKEVPELKDYAEGMIE